MIEGIGRCQPPRAVAAGSEAPRGGGIEPAPRSGGIEPAPRSSGAEGVARTVGAGKPLAGPPAALSGIAADLAAKPPVDVAKVEALRAAIISGAYRADPDAIAAAMIALESVPPQA